MGRTKLFFQWQINLNGYKNILRASRRLLSNAENTSPRTAGVLIIGDEILKGHVADTNSYFITKKLFGMGVKVKKIVVVGDNIDTVVKEVRDLSPQFTYVITTGGIGPTHDDITFEAVAKAFNETTCLHPELVEKCKKFYKTDDLTSPAMKMANVPKSAKLNYGYDKVRGRTTLYPCISVENVYVFPGVPELMERSFSILCKDLFGGSNSKMYIKEMYLTTNEVSITNALNEVVKMFPNVNFGSYPTFKHSYYKVLINMESEFKHDILQAYDKLESLIGKELIIPYDKYPLDNPYGKIVALMKDKGMKVLDDVIKNVKTLYDKHRPEDICLYLDGSKGSTALLHILYACMKEMHFSGQLTALFVAEKEYFPEVLQFIREIATRYDTSLEILYGNPAISIKSFFQEHRNLKVFVVGIPGDDDSQLQKITLEQLSGIEIVCPLQELSSPEIWTFIRSLYLPYCVLYDRGYSSVRCMVKQTELH